MVSCGSATLPSSSDQAAITVDTNLTDPTLETTAATAGLTGTYFDNMDFTGIQKTRVDGSINFNWKTAAPISGIQPTTYSVRWNGQITPKYNEEYTFFLTSSGGARLMVNGVALVNSWSDHTSKTDSKKLILKANVKYDIKVEYFRNTANPGAIKLEWQSASQVKQVVPSSVLAPIGSNVNSAINILKNNTAFKALGLVIDPSIANGKRLETKFQLFVQVKQSKALISALVNPSSQTVENLYSYSLNTITDTGVVKDLILGTTIQIPSFSQYKNSDGSFNTTKTHQNLSLFLPLIDPRATTPNLNLGAASIVSKNISGSLSSLATEVFDCANCQHIEDLVHAYEYTLIDGVFNTVACAPEAVGCLAEIGTDIIIEKTTDGTPEEQFIEHFKELYNQFLRCHTSSCLLAVDPVVLNLEGVFGTPVIDQSIMVRNKGIFAFTFKTGNILTTDGGNWLSVTPESDRLSKDNNEQLTLTAQCPSALDKTYHATFDVSLPDVVDVQGTPTVLPTAYNPPITVTINFHCLGGILETTSPIDMSTYIGYSTSSSFFVLNAGFGPLQYIVTRPNPKPWLSLSPKNGTLAPARSIDPPSSNKISFFGTCPSNFTTDTEVLVVKNILDPSQDKSVIVSLTCKVGSPTHFGIAFVALQTQTTLSVCPPPDAQTILATDEKYIATYQIVGSPAGTISGQEIISAKGDSSCFLFPNPPIDWLGDGHYYAQLNMSIQRDSLISSRHQAMFNEFVALQPLTERLKYKWVGPIVKDNGNHLVGNIDLYCEYIP